MLTAQSGSLTSGNLTKLLATAGSRGAVTQAYHPALRTALEQMLQQQLKMRKHTLDDLWFITGLLQHRLLQAAGGDPKMEVLLLGPGALTAAHLRYVWLFRLKNFPSDISELALA